MNELTTRALSGSLYVALLTSTIIYSSLDSLLSLRSFQYWPCGSFNVLLIDNLLVPSFYWPCSALHF